MSSFKAGDHSVQLMFPQVQIKIVSSDKRSAFNYYDSIDLSIIANSQLALDNQVSYLSSESNRGDLFKGLQNRRKSNQCLTQFSLSNLPQVKNINVKELIEATQQDRENFFKDTFSIQSNNFKKSEPVEKNKKKNIVVPAQLPKSKKTLKKSNAYKNFANRFRVYFIKFQNVKNLFIKEEFKKQHHKNISDNLNKKIKYENRAQTLEDMKSMLSHRKYQFMQILVKACKIYIRMYPQEIKVSNKMDNIEQNQKILRDIEEVIEILQNQMKLIQ